MNTGVKLSAYGAVLAVAFAGAWAVGNAAGPLGDGTPSEAGTHQGGHASDRPQLGGQDITPITPPPPDPPQHQQQPRAASPTAVGAPHGDRAVAPAAVGGGEPAVAPVAIAPSLGGAEQIRWVTPRVERTPRTRWNHHVDDPQGRHRGREHQHSHDQPRGRGQR